MKLFLWKIIALFSVLLGSLGPQVAAGSPVPVSAPETTVVQAQTIPVVTASLATAVVVSPDPTANCAETGFQLGRFDLILWHACDLNLQLGQATTAEVAVTNQQPSWPELSVSSGPINTISFGYAPWTAPETNLASFSGLVSTGWPDRSTSTLVRPSQTSIVALRNLEVNSDNSQQTIVLRC